MKEFFCQWSLHTAGADKTNNLIILGGADFSNIWLVKSHYCVTTVREVKYI